MKHCRVCGVKKYAREFPPNPLYLMAGMFGGRSRIKREDTCVKCAREAGKKSVETQVIDIIDGAVKEANEFLKG